MRDARYRHWLKMQLCCIAIRNGFIVAGCEYAQGVSDPAHTQNNGMGSKGPDSSCVPLCRKHHREYDAGRKAFESKYEVNMKELAAAMQTYYCAGLS